MEVNCYMNNKKRDYIVNEMLLYSKYIMEQNGQTQNAFLLCIEFAEEYYLMGAKEPKIKEESKHLKDIKVLTKCTNDEITECIKYCLSHEWFTRFCSNTYKITYLGLKQASSYEEYKKMSFIKRFLKKYPINWMWTFLAFSIGLIMNALVNLDKIIVNYQTYIIPVMK